MSIYSELELNEMGFSHIGTNCLISKKASFYGIEQISIGDNVRIDDFCVLSAGIGGINIGNYIHIAVYSSIIGAGKVTLLDYCNVSSRVSIYSSNDDYSGEYMTNPMVNEEFTNVQHAPVMLGKHVIIGSASIILPGVNIGEGCAIGAFTLVTKTLKPWGIYIGQPAKFIKARSKKLVKHERELIAMKGANNC